LFPLLQLLNTNHSGNTAMTNDNDSEFSPDEQLTVDRFLQDFRTTGAEAQTRSFLALAHVVETSEQQDPSLGDQSPSEIEEGLPLLEQELAALRKQLALYAEIRALSPSQLNRDEGYRALDRHTEELVQIAWDTVEADRFQRERETREGRKGAKQRRVQQACLRGIWQIWNTFSREHHAQLETNVRIYALAQPRSLEARLADDELVRARAHEAQRANDQLAEALRALKQHRLANPLSHPWRQETRDLENAALRRAAESGAAQYALDVVREPRVALHERQLQMERGMRGQAAKALARQHQLAKDPARQLAFEAFCQDHKSVPLPTAAVGRDLIVAKIQDFQEQPAFAVLATPKSRYGIDMRRYTFDSPPALGTRLTLQSGMKLSSEASSPKALSADSSAIGLGR
jgi:hypothetical protein